MNLFEQSVVSNTRSTDQEVAFGLRLDSAFSYCIFFMMLLSIAFPPARLLTYIIPLFAVIVCLANRKIENSPLLAPYIVVIGAFFAFIPLANKNGVQDAYLILVGCCGALAGYRYLWSWRFIFFWILSGQVFLVFLQWIFGAFSGGLSNLTIDIAKSQSSFESSFSYVFGLLAVWAAYKRQFFRFAVATLLVVITLKRIALLGVAICTFVTLMPRIFQSVVFKPYLMAFLNVICLTCTVLYTAGQFDQIILDLTGQSAGEFGQGRQYILRFVVEDLFKDSWRFITFGAGAGESYTAMKGGLLESAKINIHSDLIKIFYEFGGFIFIAFIYLLYNYRHFGVLIVALYTNIMLLTDNTLIYPFYIYFSLLVAICIERESDAAKPHNLRE